MQSKNDSVGYHITLATLGTLGVHPFRVGLNLASLNPSFLETLKQIPSCLPKGLGFNLVRGGLNTGLQSHANRTAQQWCSNPILGQLLGLMAATFTGTVVSSTAELPFMRRNAGATAINWSLFKCNRPIVQFFMLRELGFSSAVLISKDFTPSAHYSILFAAAWLTAACHKLAMIEATKNIKTGNYTSPDYSYGMKVALRSISNNKYSHPGLKVYFAHPASFFQRSVNLVFATCGPNVFFWRLAYLKAFAELLSFMKERVEQSELNRHPKP